MSGGAPNKSDDKSSSPSRTGARGGTASHQFLGLGAGGAPPPSCDDANASPPPKAKRKGSFLRKSVKGVASHVSRAGGGGGGTCGTSSRGAGTPNTNTNKQSTKALGQRTQASAGIRRRFQRGANAARTKVPLKTPPRPPSKTDEQQQQQQPAGSPALTASPGPYDDDDDDDDLTLMTSLTSDLSLSMSMSSPDRSASPAPQLSVTNRRIERAAAALDAAGHKHLEEGRVADALESYRRALKLKRRLLNDAASGGRDATSPIAQGEEAMLGATTAPPSSAASTSNPKENGPDDGSVGACTSSTGHDPHREALLASVATSVNNVCYARQMMGLASPDEALTAYQSSLELKRKVRAEKVGQAEGTDAINNEPSSESHSRQSKPTYKKKDQLNDQEQHDLSVAKTLNNIGTVHLSTGNYPSALSSFRESCGLMLSILGPDHIDVSTVHSNAGDALLGMKRYGEATEEYGRALKIRSARSGMDHRKSQRLLEKIRIAAKAAAVAKKREEEENKEAERSSSVTSSPKAPALSVETLQRWFGETDVRDFCLLTDQCESDEEDDDLFGDLKSQLENDLDRITNIGHDLEEEIMREQAAFMEEIKKMDDADQPIKDKTDDEVKKEAEMGNLEKSATDARARAPGGAPRRIRSATDANDAVREVRERLARVRARRNQEQLDDGLDALRRVQITRLNSTDLAT